MLKKVSSGRSVSKSETSKAMSEVSKFLKVGSIYPADIIKELNGNRFLLSLLGYEVIAESNLNFNSKRINVQVQKKSPKIRLKILNIDFSENKEIIDYIEKNGVILDTFSQNMISLLISHNFSFNKSNFKQDLVTITNFSQIIPSFNLIPLACYIKFYETNPEFFKTIMRLMAKNSSSLTAYEDFFYDNDEFIKSLILTISFLLGYEGLQNQQPIQSKSSDSIKKFNHIFYPDFFMKEALFRTESIELSLIVQVSRKTSNESEIFNYFFSIPMDPFHPLFINLKKYERDIQITYICDQKMVHDKLKMEESQMKKFLSNNNQNILPFQYDVVPYATFFDTIA